MISSYTLDEISDAIDACFKGQAYNCLHDHARNLLVICEKLQEREAAFRKALLFYADEENWDDNICPTIWNDGGIDLGRMSREVLARYPEEGK